MKTKKLTTRQNEVVNKLISDFQSINDTPTNLPFNLVDINKLNVDLARKEAVKLEVAAINAAMIQLKKEMLETYILKLNEDFKKGNLPLVAVESLGDICIQRTNHSFGGSTIHIRMNEVREWVKEGLHISELKIVGFEFAQDYNPKKEDTYDTIEKILASDSVQKQLIRLLNGSR